MGQEISAEINIISVIRTFFKFIRINYSLIISFFILFFVLAFSHFQLIKRDEFVSSTTASCPLLEYGDVESIVVALNNLVKGHQYDELAFLLKISKSEAENIKSINIDHVLNPLKKKEEDKYLEGRFTIYVTSYDCNLFKNLGDKLIAYLKSNEYFKLRQTYYLRQYDRVLKKLDGLIAELDSVNPLILTSYGNKKTNFPSIFLTNPGNVSETILKLYSEREEIDKLISLESDINVIEPMKNFSSVENKDLLKFLAVSLLGAFFLSLIVVFLIKIEKQ